MRIMHTADWHLGRTLEGRSRLDEQAAMIDEIIDIARRERVDLVLLAGDVYDSVNPPAAAEQLFYEGVSRLAEGGQRPVAVIAGNHDNPDRLAAAGPLAHEQGITLLGLPTANVQHLRAARTGETAVLFALPYPSESRLRELLTDSADEGRLRAAYSERVAQLCQQQAAQFKPDTVNLLMSHIYVLGGSESDSERPIQVGGAYTVDPSALTVPGAQYVALGHLHRPQTLKGDAMIRYSGSPLAYSFSEAGQAKSVTLLDIVPGQPPQLEEIYLTSGKPLVCWKAKAGIEQVHSWLDEGRDAGAWIDLELHLTSSLSMEQIQQLRKSHSGLVNIRIVYPDSEASRAASPTEQLPMDELFRRFFIRQTGGAEPDEATVQLFLELLHGETAPSSRRGAEAE